MDDRDRRAAATALREARCSGAGAEILSSAYQDISVQDAYEIQLLNIAERLAEPDRVVRGYKVGLTSRAMQEMFGVDQPDYGHLLDDMFVDDGATVPHALYLQPKVEPEIAFVLKAALKGPGVSPADVLQATASVVPALEIIDTRYSHWKMTLADTIADNASSAGVVLGGRWSPLFGLDLKTTGGVLRLNGDIIETGAGGAVLGHPAAAVAWLANTLGRFGVGFEPGHVILPGSITRAIEVVPGDVVEAEFDRLGAVSVRFE